MNAPSKFTGHSADVRAHLSVNGRNIDVAQLGPGYLILRDPIETPPVAAILTFQIDGNKEVRHLWLTAGIKSDQPRTPISAVQPNQAVAG